MILSRTTSSFLFFLKKPGSQTQKFININYFIIILIKMRLLIFFILSQNGLACKYGVISKYQYIIGRRIVFLIPGVTTAKQASLQQKRY